jgi:hypothetical protein
MSPNHSFQADTVITRNNDPLQADLDGEIIMVGLEQGNYYGLGSVGSRIWELLEQPATKGQLVARLLEEYAVEQEVCEQQTIGFLNDLLDHGLISING